MLHENIIVKVVIFVLFVLVAIALVTAALKVLKWLISGLYFIVRKVFSFFFCGFLGLHKLEETGRRSNSDHYHVDYGCIYCSYTTHGQKS